MSGSGTIRTQILTSPPQSPATCFTWDRIRGYTLSLFPHIHTVFCTSARTPATYIVFVFLLPSGILREITFYPTRTTACCAVGNDAKLKRADYNRLLDKGTRNGKRLRTTAYRRVSTVDFADGGLRTGESNRGLFRL